MLSKTVDNDLTHDGVGACGVANLFDCCPQGWHCRYCTRNYHANLHKESYLTSQMNVAECGVSA